MVPSLVDSIKAAGLVLVADTSEDGATTRAGGGGGSMGLRGVEGEGLMMAMPEGVNGVLRGDGVLRFSESVDM